MYKVQEVAKIAGVSVRTLHHYDHIGLLKPSTVGENRYRYYSEEDLKLLQHILFFKELGFSLKQIQEIVGSGFDPDYALSQHTELLRMKKARIELLLKTIEQTKDELRSGTSMPNADRFRAFSAGKTDIKTERYTNPPSEPAVSKEVISDDEVGKEADRIYRTVAALMHLSPETSAVQTEMAAYYTLLNRSFDCNPSVFHKLGDLYVNDARFTSSIDQHGEGLSAFLREAMHVYADRLSHA